jgi:molecular chaperone DnaK (HSP70)
MQIVPAGQEIPKEGLTIDAVEPLTTNFDQVSSMAIVVYENTLPKLAPGGSSATDSKEFVNQDGMKRLAGTSLRGIPQGPRGQEKVQVMFHVGQDNMLKVTARSLSLSGVVTELSVDELYG